MFKSKPKIIHVSNDTRAYVRDVHWSLDGFKNPPDRALMQTQVAVPGVLMVKVWALHNALMAVIRDPARGIDDPLVLDWSLLSEIDGLRADLAGELMSFTRYNTTMQPFGEEQDAA